MAPPTNTQQQFRNQITDSTKKLLGMLGKQIVFKLTLKISFFYLWQHFGFGNLQNCKQTFHFFHFKVRAICVFHHFQQLFSYIVTIIFMVEENTDSYKKLTDETLGYIQVTTSIIGLAMPPFSLLW